MKTLSHLFKLWLVILLIIIFKTQKTDADLFDIKIFKENKITGATLDFTNVSTSNNQEIPTMFNINNIVQNGFEIKSLKIITSGTLDVNYNLKFSQKENQNNLCENLNLNILSSDFSKSYFNSNLNDLDIALNELKLANTFIFVLTNNAEDSKKGTCIFDFDISSPKDISINDQEYITNYVSN